MLHHGSGQSSSGDQSVLFSSLPLHQSTNVPMIKTEVLWESQTSLVDSEVKFDPVCVSDDEDPPAVTTSVILTETNPVDVHGQRFFTVKKGCVNPAGLCRALYIRVHYWILM